MVGKEQVPKKGTSLKDAEADSPRLILKYHHLVSPPQKRKSHIGPKLTLKTLEAGSLISNRPRFTGEAVAQKANGEPQSHTACRGETAGPECRGTDSAVPSSAGILRPVSRAPARGTGLDPEVGKRSEKRATPPTMSPASSATPSAPRFTSHSHSPAARREEVGVVFVARTEHRAAFRPAAGRKPERFQGL